MATRRPTGLIPEDPSPNDELFGSLFRSAPEIKSEVFLTDHFRYDLDQWPNNSCVWFALSNAVWAAQSLAGIQKQDRMLISPPFGYYYTLRRQHGQSEKLVDKGVKPSQAVEVLNGLGACDWSDWPHDPTKPTRCLTEPPGNLAIRATDNDGDWIKLVRLDGWGADRIKQFKQSYSMPIPRPVIAGLSLDAAYMDLTDGIWPGRTGTLEGRHMVTFNAFDELGPYPVTSWGPEWAIGGIGHMSWDALISAETTDLYSVWVDVDKMPRKRDA